MFDTHAHLGDDLLTDLSGILTRMADAGVSYCATIGTSRESSIKAADIARGHPNVYASVGVHCEYAATFSASDLEWMRELAAEKNTDNTDKKVVAIGEIGLDYYWPEPDHDVQRDAFIAQLELARELRLPAILHIRDSHTDMLDLLCERRSRLPALIAHCFSGGPDLARQYLDLGAYISFAGNVTYKNAAALREAAMFTPQDRLLIETDAPYLSPMPFRGKPNEPARVALTAAYLAQLRQMDFAAFAETTTNNAAVAFNIKGITSSTASQ